jgi:PAS domain S-box-containing protein
MSAKILVVDDSGIDQKIIASMLVTYNVLLANDGIEALRMIEDNPDIDIMLLKLDLPNMDGLQVLEIMRSNKRYKKVRTIIITDYDEPENEIKGLQLGAADYIRKPIHIESLKARIEIHVELLKAQQLLEEKLLENKLTFDTVLQQGPVGIAILHSSEPYSDDSYFINMNAAFEQITGRNKEELNGMEWEKITYTDDVEAERENFKKLKNGEVESYSLEKRLIKPDGSLVWVDAVVTNLFGKTGQVWICMHYSRYYKEKGN